MKILIVSLVIFGNLCLTYSTPVDKCDHMPPPVLVEVAGCKEPPCDFVSGVDVVMKVTFDCPHDAIIVKPRVIASTMGVDVDYPLPQQNACMDMIRGACPIEEGHRPTYQLTMPILSSYPKISIDIKFSLYTVLEDGKELDLTCFKLKGKVV